MKGVYSTEESAKNAAKQWIDDSEVYIEKWRVNSEEPLESYRISKKPLVVAFDENISFEEWCEKNPRYKGESIREYEERMIEEWGEFRS